MSWIALKARTDCPECGLPVMLEGPWANLICPSCRSETAIGYYWSKLVASALDKAPGGRRFAPKFLMDTSKPITTLHYAVNKGQPPICSGCDVVLEGVDQIATGTDGSFHCAACGASHDTFPTPKHVQGGALQVFLAVREDQQLAESAAPSAKPVMFNCINCGGNLKITTETTRVVTCQYCEVDLFLPQALWNALHPVRKRRAFWMRTR
jgi:predicted RNA-binding Zn-ribbon protein involved in translation (DUF1610 family)